MKTHHALITGASSGLGAEYARQLAAAGNHLILVARRVDRLNALAAELTTQNHLAPGSIEVLAADLSDETDLERVCKHIAEINDLDLLVNNAGFGLKGTFLEADFQKQMQMLQVHVVAAIKLTRAALPGMLARRHGGVINVSSVASFLPMSNNTIYSPTKVFLNYFSETLQTELTGSGVYIQSLCPGFTRTEFHQVMDYEAPLPPSFTWLSAEAVVRTSLNSLGSGKVILVPGFFYNLFVPFMRSYITGSLILWLIRRFKRSQPLSQ